jgi:p21-activated kinase 2
MEFRVIEFIYYLRMIAIELAEGEPPFLRMPPIKAMYEIVTRDAPTIN